MKRIFASIAVAVSALAVISSCTKTDLSSVENRLDNIENGLEDAEGRLDAIEASISSINAEIQSLQYLKEGKVINTVSGSDKEGWVIRFADGTVINVYPQMEGTKLPVLSISEDGYWLVDYSDGNGAQYLRDSNGDRVAAVSSPGEDGKDGKSPVLAIDSNGYWTISYDGGATYTRLCDDKGNPVKAKVESNDSIFSSVDYVSGSTTATFYLNNGKYFTCPVVADFSCVVKTEDSVVSVEYGASVDLTVEMKGIASAIVTCPFGWKSVLSTSSISITAPAKDAVGAEFEGAVSILAVSTNGYSVITVVSVKAVAPAKDPSDYDSYYALYNDEGDINVGGVIVNKATYGEATLLKDGAVLSDDSVIPSTYNKGVFFVEKGAKISYTSTWKRLFEGGDAILIGDATDGSRSTLVITGGGLLSYLPSGAYGVAFKNIDIESTASQPLFNGGSGSKVSWLVFDNCKFAGVVNALFVENAFKRNIGRIVFKDSEFRICKANTYFLQSTACTVDEYVVDNCIFYPETDGSLLGNPTIFACLASSITITNNTFVNLHNTQLFGNNGTTYPAAFAPKIGNNLRYYTVGPAGGTSAIFHLGWTGVDPVNLTPDGVYINGGNTNGTAFKPVYSENSVVDNVLDADPFSKLDFANGVFTNISNYGAKR